jgi:hypothetical protein
MLQNPTAEPFMKTMALNRGALAGPTRTLLLREEGPQDRPL